MLIDDWIPVNGPLPINTPVAESLPDDTILVLLAFTDGDVWPGYRDGDIWRDASAMPITEEHVVAWMHFPPAPERRAA